MKNLIIDKILKHPYVVIFVLTFAIYSQTIFFEFVGIDDSEIIIDQYEQISDIRNIGEAFLHDAFFTHEMTLYRPLLTISLILNAQLGGTDPYIYNFTNILIHALTACLVLALFRELEYSLNISLTIALIFAVHPVFINPVNWIVARDGMLATIFCILSFLMFIKFMSEKNWKNYVLHILTFSLAVFSKEIALAFPAIFVVHYFQNKEIKLGRQTQLALLLSWILVIVLFFYLRSLSMEEGLITNIKFGLDPFIQNLAFIPESIYKFILPFDHSVLPSFSFMATTIGIILIPIATVIIFMKKSISRSRVILGIFWFFILAFPAMVIRYPTADIYFEYVDNRIYIISIGLFIILAELLRKKWSLYNKKHLTYTVFILFVFSFFTIFHSLNYSSPEVFWHNAVAHNPKKPMVHYRLGYCLWKREIEHLKKGNIVTQQDINEVVNHFENSLQLYGEHENRRYVLKNLTNFLIQIKRYDQAYSYGEEIKRWISLHPEHFEYLSDVLKTLSGSLLDKGAECFSTKEYRSGIKYTKLSLQMSAGNSVAYTNLGMLFKANGVIDSAETSWKKAIDINPNDTDPYKHLLVLYMEQKRYTDAAEYSDKVIRHGGEVSDELKDYLKEFKK